MYEGHHSGGNTSTENPVSEDFERIYRAHARYVLALMRRHFGLPQHVAEELAHDVFEVVFLRLAEVSKDQRDSVPAMRAWVFRIAWNLVANYRKRHSYRNEEPFAELPEVPFAPDAETCTHARELAGWLDSLSTEEAEIFVGFEVYGMTARELGARLQLDEGEVRRVLEEARKSLRRQAAK